MGLFSRQKAEPIVHPAVERIVYVRTLIHTNDDESGGKSIDSVATGQYL